MRRSRSETMPERKNKNQWTSIILIFIITFAITNFIFRTVVASVKVVGDSMYPTLHDQDYGYVDLMTFKASGIERFEILVINEPSLNELIVKRVVGLPNETISSYGGNLYINGEIINQPFISQTQRLATQISTITLGESEYFVLGDNRQNSTDSRAFGPIQESEIFARGFLKMGECSDFNCSVIFYQWPEFIN